MTSEDEWLRSGRVRAPPTEMTRELRDDSEAWHDSEPREGASALNANSWSGIGAIPKQGGGNHEDFQTAAKLLGISGEVLANFLSAPKHEGQKTDQFFPAVESQDQLKKEIGEMLSDRDSDRQRDREFERIEREKDRRAQADMLRAIVDMNRPNRNPEVECFKVKFDAMEDKDDVDSYLEHYERIAALHRWPRHIMALRLLPLLKGQARDCVRDIPDEEITSYEVIKRALLFRFKRTPEYFRKKFRTSRREEGESFLQAVNKMVDQAKKWCTMTGCDRRDPEQVWNLFMKEACYQLLPPELETRVREREPSKYQDIAKIADTIFEARSATRMSRSLQPGSQSNVKPQGSKPVTVPNSDKRQDFKDAPKFRKDGCHNCGSLAHFKKDCPKKNKVNVSMVVTKPEDKPDLSLCDNDREREFEPRGRAIVNGQEVSALRDTGAEAVVVASRLVKEVDWTGCEVRVRLADANVCGKFKTAIVHLESPYLDEKVEAIVMDNPSADVILGNRATLDDGTVVKIPVFPREGAVQVGAVTTRSQDVKKKTKPLPVSSPLSTSVDRKQLAVQQETDASLAKARESAKEGAWMKAGKQQFRFLFKNQVLFREYRDDSGTHRQICVPIGLRQEVMRVAHDTPMAGHLAAQRTRERLWNDFYWPGMCGDIRRYCQSCDRCQRICPKSRVKKAPLGKLPLVGTPFERVAVDLIGPLIPASEEGHKWVLVMVDYATRYPEARALKNIDTENVAEALLDMWSRVGIPEQVLSDRGTQFLSEVMLEVHRLLSIKGLTTTPYHAQCNGLVERFNGTLKTMLRKLCDEKPNTWHRYLSACLFAYREVPQESTGFSPFELLYGRTVRGPMTILRNLWTSESDSTSEVSHASTYVLELRNRIEETCKLVQRNLARAGDKYRQHFDKKTKMRTFKEGDLVLLLLPTKQNKLEMAWRGPFSVESRQGQFDYWVDVDGKKKLYHLNMLKEYHRRPKEVPVKVCSAAVVEEEEEWEEISYHTGSIPLIPLRAEESFKDVKLDPECPEIHAEMKKAAEDFQDVLTDLPKRTTISECEILLEPDTPVRMRQYPLPFAEREMVGKEVEEMLKLGVIEKSNSPFCSPILLVKKKDGKMRFCQDLRKLNKHVVFDAEPMPDIELLFAKLSKAKYLSKIDLTKGYWQIPMKDDDKPKTAFSTPQGHFQWTVMPFGLKTAGAIFSRMMRKLIQPLGLTEVENFMDDILIATLDMESHISCVRKVLSRLREVTLAAKPSKVYLGFAELDYLGHRVGRGVVKPDEEKMDKIRHADRPETKKQVRSFLGLAGFYRRFVPNFAEIALPLTEATRNQAPLKVKWDDACERSFQQLKSQLCEQPVCALPDFDRTFVVRTDASDSGLGAILIQDQGFGDQTIACASRKLNAAEKNYSTIEKELLAVVWGVQKFSPYLYGKEFILQSDHLPLKHLDNMKNTNGRLMRWAMQLQPFAYVFKSIPGKENVGADFLSRL